ncbi:hypothetical protein [Vibrio owensii]|uniref:hypothetical protein n=1 Tax=Vibrio owensii TaxID=696485 RepID=UPI003CC53BD9
MRNLFGGATALACFLAGVLLMAGFYTKGAVARLAYDSVRSELSERIEDKGWHIDDLSSQKNLIGTDFSETVRLTKDQKVIVFESKMVTNIDSVKGKVRILEQTGLDESMSGYLATWEINTRDFELVQLEENMELAEKLTGLELN